MSEKTNAFRLCVETDVPAPPEGAPSSDWCRFFEKRSEHLDACVAYAAQQAPKKIRLPNIRWISKEAVAFREELIWAVTEQYLPEEVAINMRRGALRAFALLSR